MLRITEPSPKGKPDATTAACLVSQDHQVNQDETENQANLVFPELPVFLVAHHWKFAQKSHRHHANHAHRDHPDPQVHLENPVILAPTAHQATLAKTAATDHRAHQDPTDHPVNQAKTEKKDHPEIQLLVPQRLQENPDHQEKTDHQAHPVKTVNQAQMVLQDPLETKDHLDQPAHQETMVLQETKAHLDQMDRKENRVFAPNIAPPMVVFSSKMEQGDKKVNEFFNQGSLFEINEKPVPLMSNFALFAFVFFISCDSIKSKKSKIFFKFTFS